MLYSDLACALAHLVHKLNNAQRSHFQGIWLEIVVSCENVLSYGLSFDRLRQHFSARRVLRALGLDSWWAWWQTNSGYGVWNTPRAA